MVNAQNAAIRELKTTNDTISYCIGISIANSLQNMNIGTINPDLISQALSDVIVKKNARFTNEACRKNPE